jgi:hypothetical protein
MNVIMGDIKTKWFQNTSLYLCCVAWALWLARNETIIRKRDLASTCWPPG